MHGTRNKREEVENDAEKNNKEYDNGGKKEEEEDNIAIDARKTNVGCRRGGIEGKRE